MHNHIPQAEKRDRQSRRRRRKKRIQLFLNFSMLVCILSVIFCIGVVQNRERYEDNDRNTFVDGMAESGAGTVGVRVIEPEAANDRANIGETETANGKADIGGPEAANGRSDISGTDVAGDNEDSWRLILVNKWNPLPENLEIEVVMLSNGERVDERIYPYLQEMFDDARAEGIYPIVRSGYRTRQEQEDIYYDRLTGYQEQGLSEEEARAETELWVAVPGTSEHELGLAVDINADKIHSEGAEVYTWLKDHAHLYGFINRYPLNKTKITGISNEPWHYRYVGVEAATEIYEKGICLEEYLGKVEG